MAKIGYARVSTDDQSLDLQKDALKDAGCSPIYEEQVSGAKSSRPELMHALLACRPGDIFVVWKLDRLGRNMKHLLEIVEELQEKQVGFQCLTGMPFDTSTAHGMLILQIFAALSEYERGLLRERTMAGLQAARARGRKGGRRPKLSHAQQVSACQMAKGGMPILRIAETLACSPHTVRKALAHAETLLAAAD